MEKTVEHEWGDDDREKMIGSPSDGKMVIKLKIPKLAESAIEGEGSSSKTEEEKRVCVECKKEFSSGKALGGHMRVHVTKNPNFLKPAKAIKFKKTSYQASNNGGEKQKPYYMNSVNEEGKPTCSQCGKTFPSMKSLFGHMRCHPERVWRGILPPPTTPTTPAAVARRRFTVSGSKPNPSASGSEHGDGGDDQVVGLDLTRFLRGWSVTDRRGRKALKAAEDDDVLLGAVEDLLSLANGGSTAESSELKVEENEGKLNFSDNESDIKNTNEQQLLISYKCQKNSVITSPNKIKRRKKMKLMMELEQEQNGAVLIPEQQQQQQEQEGVSVTECKYKCNTCNKCFATHQALGGHRSSHNKSKFTAHDHHHHHHHHHHHQNQNQNEEDDHESFVMMMGQCNENVEKVLHQCKICDKVFATGQALGGHKRCHWNGTIEPEAQAPSSQITSTGEAASSGRKVLDFDLNEMPPVMMEEDESYNSNMG